jgi:hypothetical protein
MVRKDRSRSRGAPDLPPIVIVELLLLYEHALPDADLAEVVQ